MPTRLSYEQIHIGETWTSDSRTITEADVVNFATSTGDFNPLHVSHEFASQTHYRQPIAHGLLGMCWVAGLGSNAPSVDTVAFVAVRNWEFLRPLYFGDTVHVITTVVNKTSKGRRNGKVEWELQLINQRNEVTQRGIFETIVRIDASAPKPHFTDRDSATSAASVLKTSEVVDEDEV